jgi:hypothetical protein
VRVPLITPSDWRFSTLPLGFGLFPGLVIVVWIGLTFRLDFEMFWDEDHARTARTFRSQVIGLEKRFMPESRFSYECSNWVHSRINRRKSSDMEVLIKLERCQHTWHWLATLTPPTASCNQNSNWTKWQLHIFHVSISICSTQLFLEFKQSPQSYDAYFTAHFCSHLS